jgi:hypothetical protein
MMQQLQNPDARHQQCSGFHELKKADQDDPGIARFRLRFFPRHAFSE